MSHLNRSRLVCWVVLSFGLAIPVNQVLARKPTDNVISVSGSSEIRVVADQMVITGSITSGKKTIAEASAANATLVKQTQVALEKMKVLPKDMRFERISISPIHQTPQMWAGKKGLPQQPQRPNSAFVRPPNLVNANQPKTLNEPVGFSVVRHFEITISDLDSYENIYQTLIESGVTSITSTSLKAIQLKDLQRRARLDAVKAAKEKAVAMAEALGVKLVGVKSISESDTRLPSSFSSVSFSSPSRLMTPATGIPSGSISVGASVKVVFYMENAPTNNSK